jgi:hypothetical protein
VSIGWTVFALAYFCVLLPLDLGFVWTVPQLLNRYVARDAVYLMYCALNVAGLALLLVSRYAQREPQACLFMQNMHNYA